MARSSRKVTRSPAQLQMEVDVLPAPPPRAPAAASPFAAPPMRSTYIGADVNKRAPFGS